MIGLQSINNKMIFDESKDEIIKSSGVFPERANCHHQGVKNTRFSQSLDIRKVTVAQEGSRGQAKLMVAVRCRPLLKHELKANLYEIVRIMDKKVNNHITFHSSLYFLIR